MTTPGHVEHFFRHEYGKLVAVLSRRIGIQHIETIEDAVQSALMKALETWPRGDAPQNPSAWLFRVARNEALATLRQGADRHRILEASAPEFALSGEGNPEALLPGEQENELLRLLFACCHDALPLESQLVFALKTLCGFSVPELAHRLFISEANAYKRLERARRQLRSDDAQIQALTLTARDCAPRLPAVHMALYVLFTEGYQSSHADFVIRRELCDEAMRLTLTLAEHPVGRTPATFALLALMHLHDARMTGRQDGAGGLLLLEEQNRASWDRAKIQVGLHWLAKSAKGETFSRFHAEAGIAAEHCLAPSFRETRWDAIVECYELLERVAPSALHRLNRAVAVAERDGAREGLAQLKGFEPPGWLAGSYMWAAVQADLHRRCGNAVEADAFRETALELAPSAALRALLTRRLAAPGDCPDNQT